MSLGQTVPALPVTSVPDAVTFYGERLGFVAVHQDEGFAIVMRDAAELHLWEAGDTGWSTRDPASLTECPVRSGAESFIAGTGSCRIAVSSAAAIDVLYGELAAADVLHPIDGGSAVDTDVGTREFAVLDGDGNLLSFFHRTLLRRQPTEA